MDCVAEVPLLKELYSKYRSRGLEIVGISLDDEPFKAGRFVAEKGIGWPQICDGKADTGAIPRRSQKWLTWLHLKVLNATLRCRTAALGGHVDACSKCGHEAISFNSCRNRHCRPQAQRNGDLLRG